MEYKLLNLSRMARDAFENYKEDVERMIDKLVKKYSQTYSKESLLYEIMSGSRELWAILDNNDGFKAFATTSLDTLANGKRAIEVLELAGEGGENLTSVLELLELEIKDKDIDFIRPYGRLGWSKALKKLGYKISYVVYEKELKDVNGR